MVRNISVYIDRVRELMVETLELDISPQSIELEEELLLDSISALSLLERIEEEFNIGVEDEELVDELFHSVKSIAEFVLLKKGNAHSESLPSSL